MKKTLTAAEAKARLEYMCARSEQCTYDLRRKLYLCGVPPGEHDGIISDLIEGRFVDDLRFATAYVRDKYRFDRWGRGKIVRGLMAKRIPADIVRTALEAIDGEEYVRICAEVMRGRLKMMPKECDEWERRQKLMRYGVQRGFEPKLIATLLDKWGY